MTGNCFSGGSGMVSVITNSFRIEFAMRLMASSEDAVHSAGVDVARALLLDQIAA